MSDVQIASSTFPLSIYYQPGCLASPIGPLRMPLLASPSIVWSSGRLFSVYLTDLSAELTTLPKHSLLFTSILKVTLP